MMEDASFGASALTRGERYYSEIGGVGRILRSIPDGGARRVLQPPARAVIAELDTLYRNSSNRYVAAKNGFLVLDTIFNMGLAGRREEAIRILEARRGFLRLQRDSASEPGFQHPQPEPDWTTPRRHMRLLLGLSGCLPGAKGRVIRDALRLLRIRRLTASIFADYARQRLLSSEVRARIEALKHALQDRLRQAQQGCRAPANLWQLCRQVSSQAPEALELLGVFGSQHRTLRKTILSLSADPGEPARLIDALHDSAEIFFLIQEIGELERSNSPCYDFAYPAEFRSSNPRFYHFWSSAFLACRLRSLGHAVDEIHWVSAMLARAYETYTLPLNLAAARTLGASLALQLRNWREDVASHRQGTAFGLLLGDRRDA